MFIVWNECVGRINFRFWQKWWADFVCHAIGHNLSYPRNSVYSPDPHTTYASAYCSRCYKGGYDTEQLISTQ